MKNSPTSVLEDVNDLRSLVASVLPQLLSKLDLIGNKLENTSNLPSASPISHNISTQTEGEFVGETDGAEADESLEAADMPQLLRQNHHHEDGIPLEDLLWAEATLQGGIKVESSSDGGAAEGIESCEDECADNGLQRSAGDTTYGDVEQFVLTTTEDEWTERSTAAEEYVISSHAPDVKPDLASTSDMNINVPGTETSGNQQAAQQNRISRVKGRFKCRYCSKTFKQKYNVVEHERIHTGEKPFKCSYCPKAFNQKGNAVEHERIHTGEKPFKCRYCPKTFSRRGSARFHERIHSVVPRERYHPGVKPFKCSYCPKSFNQKCNVDDHERIHTGEKPFKCSYCPKAFKQKGNAVEHEKIHTGEKPFKCSYCPKTFSRRGSVRSHERVHSQYASSKTDCARK